MNVPVCWRSKAQRGVTLSSSEAEYVAISEAVKEIKFIYYLLQGFGIEIDLPERIVEDGIIKIEFVRSIENNFDIFIKNPLIRETPEKLLEDSGEEFGG